MKNSLQISRHPSKRWVHGLRMMAFLLVVLSSLTARAQLSGTYTICPSGCTYSTISDAVTDLQNNGVSGAVTMQIKPGSYNETIDLNGVSGLSSTNTLTFKGTGSKNTDVHIYDGSNSYVWYMYDMRYVTLENLHIEQTTASDYYFGLYLSSSEYITVKNCRLTADTKGGGYYDNCAALLEYCNYITFDG